MKNPRVKLCDKSYHNITYFYYYKLYRPIPTTLPSYYIPKPTFNLLHEYVLLFALEKLCFFEDNLSLFL